ncbi:MAG: hypothetical protein NUW23_02480 [Firmicutes bacterium]|jgi:hypothetical protein|nr:hypothetical protein [Bacillota bacterium]
MDDLRDKVRLDYSVPTTCPDCGGSLTVIAYSTLTRHYRVQEDRTATLEDEITAKDDDTLVLACDACAYEKDLHVTGTRGTWSLAAQKRIERGEAGS